VFKLDFSNAFNSLHRDEALAEKVPEIYKFCETSYFNMHSILKFRDHLIQSEVGPRQGSSHSVGSGSSTGDLLGPLLFCLSIHPLFQSLSSSLSIGFLDDVTLSFHLFVFSITNVVNR